MIMGLYTITNIVNKKFLIGSTVNLSSRRSQHFSQLRKGVHPNPHLQSAWNKYGEEKFTWNEEFTSNKIEDIRAAEQFWIDFFWNYSKEEIYNCNKLANGGNSTTWSDDRKKRFSAHLKRNNPMSSPVSREKVRKSKIGVPRPDLAERNKKLCSKRVYKKTISGEIIDEYVSVKIAAIKNNVHSSGIYNNCLGYNKSAYGYIWSYV